MTRTAFAPSQSVYMNGEPCAYIARENRHESWVEKADGTVLRVFTAGLSSAAPARATRIRFTIDPRGTDGAR